ncbi:MULTISPECIES: DUF4097 family beta strand repeat-containing protein [Limosilactobacillus]|jgi:hypothetical protein|uniref:DUF4097 family beta strand repeat-containing protein n=1 Tax=Limosilactobacillus sp. TaxID=2773925 RepID=UPI0024321DD1|nr:MULTISPECIES: DUF4097 family beta strand repeat-containing protein [Limosilactobacillus]MCC6096607.1 DUF4097 domain-containing protein [Limosilactobacillus sp.]
MKKTIVSGLVITVIGAVVLAFGIGMHGQRAVIFDGLTPHVISKAKTTRTQTYAKAERIKADVSDMNVVIKSGKTFSVKYAGEKINQPTIQKKNGTVIINSKSRKLNGFSFSSTGFYRGGSNDKLTITVPENVNLKHLALRVNDASQVSLSNLEIEQADFRLNDTDTAFNGVTINSGQLHLNDNDLAINDSTLTKIMIQTADSDITMNSVALDGGSLSTQDGDVHFNDITIANGYSITAKDGDVEALNTKADGYSTSVSDGDNRLFNQSNDNGGTLTQNDTAPNCLQVTASDGDVTIR